MSDNSTGPHVLQIIYHMNHTPDMEFKSYIRLIILYFINLYQFVSLRIVWRSHQQLHNTPKPVGWSGLLQRHHLSAGSILLPASCCRHRTTERVRAISRLGELKLKITKYFEFYLSEYTILLWCA